MRGGRLADAYSMYKRASTKDQFTDYEDRQENIGSPENGVWKEIGNPSWKRPLPHILVAIISSFLFGYHLGVVNDTLESMSLDLDFSGSSLAEEVESKAEFSRTCCLTLASSLASLKTIIFMWWLNSFYTVPSDMIILFSTKGLVVSTCLGGALLGSIFSGWIADGVGRRRGFQLCALPMIIGASMSAATSTLGLMLLGRLLVGIGMGLGPAVAALYVAEVSPAFVRGTYGSFTQIATCLGILGSLLIGIPAKDNVGWWRVCFWISTIPAALLAVLMEFCAESPHWLVKRGRIDLAEEELEKLMGAAHVKYAIAEMSKTDKGDEVDNVRFGELLYGRHFKVVFIGSALFALQQLSGINAVFYFSSTVFKKAGVPSDIANTCVGIVNLTGSIIAMILMDRLGRKVLLIGSFLGMAIATGFQVAAASSFVPSFAVLYLSVGGTLLCVLAFSLGAGPVPSLLLSEIFPGRIRAKAMALCMAAHWVINFLVGLLFLPMLEHLGPQIVYAIFASFCLLAVAFVKKNVVETKGKTLQEIEFALLPSH